MVAVSPAGRYCRSCTVPPDIFTAFIVHLNAPFRCNQRSCMRTTGTAVALIVWIVLATVSMQAQISYPDFRSIPVLKLGGVAEREGDRLRLTPSRPNSVGAAWHGVRQYVGEGFITTFKFQVSAPGGESDGVANGGDGIAFVIQNSVRGTDEIGYPGGEMGYGGIPRSLAVEFDMWNNGFSVNADPNHNHISIQTNGIGRNSSDHGYSRGQSTIIPEMGDGGVHTVSIEYMEKRLAIYLDNCEQPVLEIAIDLAKVLGLEDGYAWFGLTAGTASAWQNHDILSWHSSSIGLLQSSSSTLCSGDSLILTIPTVDGQCIWSNGSRESSIVVRDSGEYSVVVLERLGCRDLYYERAAKVSVSPRPDPVLTIHGSTKLCPGDSVILDVGPGYSSYRWSNGARTESIVVKTEGTYTVQVTNEFGCARNSKSVDVVVHKPVRPLITPDRSLALCPGDSLRLDAGDGYLFYRWSTGALTRSITVRDSGLYTVEGVDRNGCTTISEPVRVSIGSKLQPVVVASGPTTLCQGEAVRLDAGGEYASYRWSNGATTRSILVTEPGDYSVDVVSSGGCRGSSASVPVLMNPRPLPAIISDRDPVVCRGRSVMLDAGAGYASYAWSNGDTTRRISVDRPGRYVVMVTTEHGCTGSATIDVIEGLAPHPMISPAGTISICYGDSVMLDAGAGYASYVWSNGERARRISVRDTGTYRVTVTSKEGCIGISDSVVVVRSPSPVPIITPDGPLGFCTGASLTLRAPAGYARYRWSTGETTESIEVRTSGRYVVTVVEPGGCSGESPALDVVVGDSLLPGIAVGGPTLLCMGDSVRLEAPGGYPGYLWSTGERTQHIVVRSPGSYVVEVDAGNGCRGTSAPVIVQVRPGPATPVITEIGGDLHATGTAADGYQWYLDGTPLADGDRRTHAPARSGLYTVMVTDVNGCTATSPPFAWYHAVANVALPTMAGAPGASIAIPLTLQSSRNLDEEGAGRFRVMLRFDRTLLIPSAVTSCCGLIAGMEVKQVPGSARDHLLVFEGVRPAGLPSGVLAEVHFTLALGSASTAPLHITSFEWLDGHVGISTTDGLVQFSELCGEGGERLVSGSGNLALKPVRPNPSSGTIMVDYEIVEDGPTELYLSDMRGSRVATLVSGSGRRGAYAMAFDTRQLPSGIYFLVLQTPTERLNTEVRVAR